MRFQAIHFDATTGVIRQVLDPERDLTAEEVVALLKPEPHEAVIAYEKQPGKNGLPEWQQHVAHHMVLK